MAVLRGTSFGQMQDLAHPARGGATVGEIVAKPAALSWFDPSAAVTDQGTPREARRRAARHVEPQTGAAPSALDASTPLAAGCPAPRSAPTSRSSC